MIHAVETGSGQRARRTVLPDPVGKMGAIMKRMKLILAALLCLLSAAILLSLLLSTHALSVSKYRVECRTLKLPLRIVQLSDLHNHEFGKDNARLIRKVRQQEPDLIVLTGDMLNQDEDRTDVDECLVQELVKIAPVYASNGNHERQFEQRYQADLQTLYRDAGARLLEREWVDLEIKGQALRIGGAFGYCLPGDILENSEAEREMTSFLEQFQDTDKVKLLLCHMPFAWIVTRSLDYWDVDIVFAGHAHGGQVRFPWIGGLYAPDQNWFPGECAGLYPSKDGDSTMVLSRGLGGSGMKLPRFNNIPEIVVLDLVPAQA